MANEKRLIDANILESWIDGGIQGAEEVNGNAPIVSLYDVLDELDNIPTVDAVEVKHGRWEERIVDHEIPYYMVADCSLCGCSGESWHNYCPNCGAKMDGGNEDG